MRCSSIRRNDQGFTLVEILIIAPIVILAIGAFVALMVGMVADVLVTRDQNNMTYETQDALDLIEQDTRLATQFLVTTKALPSPQGSDNDYSGTDAFTNASSTLIMGGLTTNKNPADPTREIVYYAGQPNVCGSLQAYNRPFLSKIIYFLKDNSLWRRVVLPNYNTNAVLDDNTVCSMPWQRNTCSPGYSSSTRCQTNDSEIMQNVDTFNVKYFDDPKATVEVGSANALSATTIEVSLSGKKKIAGRDITAAGSMRATKLNNIDVEIPAPGSPDVSYSIDGNTVTFSWPKVPLASSYLVRYNTNGGAWEEATLNSQTTQQAVTRGPNDTITIEVRAHNSSGTSPTTTSVATVPAWYTCNLNANWDHYGAPYATPGYAKTIADVVALKGLVKYTGTLSANTPICTLPVGYRPTHRLVFATSSTNAAGRIDIAPNGEVRFVTGSAAWISLDGIRFVASTTSYSWSSPPLFNPWEDYGGDLSPRRTTLDNQGRVHTNGVVKNGTAVSTIFELPTGQRKVGQFTYLPVSVSTGFGYMGMGGTGGVTVSARTNPGTHFSLQSMFYPEPYANWINFGTVANPLKNNWEWINLGNHATPSYTKAADGIVTLKGLIKKATHDNGTTIATLPPGYRPKERLLTSCVANEAFCRIDIMPNGDIVDVYTINNGWVSLDNISFMAEQ